ncbi:glycosyltransferase, partial [Gordonia alkanivorans]|uniref:glycosyltransferase n=1 Tax=Gordonia alkanivorans TaxID=84096 RepID=UPI001E650DB6
MRVTVVHSFYSDAQPSGENTVVQAQVDELSKDHTVNLVERRTSELIGSSAYKIRAALYSSGLASNRAVLDEIEATEPDLVHVHNTFPNIGTRWLSSLNIPYVLTAHNYRMMCSNA